MAKPRIIIADTEVDFVVPLQLRFVEVFFNDINLEIITKKEYFTSLFSSPQKADVLIVSQDLYDESLVRHDITNCFLMTEQREDEEAGTQGPRKLYKYSSLMEIFNVIVGVITPSDVKKKGPQVVLVTSAGGGTGKTTVALGLCTCLAKNYNRRVLYINATRLNTYQRFLENKSPITAADAYAAFSNSGKYLYSNVKHIIRREIFSYLPPFKAALMSLGLQYSLYTELALSAKESGEYDYIFVDTDSVFDEDKARLISAANRVVIVTKQNSSSVFSTNILAANIDGISSDKFIFICNDFKTDENNALVSSTNQMRYIVNEYVEHFADYDSMSCSDISKRNGIQKATTLFL